MSSSEESVDIRHMVVDLARVAVEKVARSGITIHPSKEAQQLIAAYPGYVGLSAIALAEEIASYASARGLAVEFGAAEPAAA